MKQCISLIMGCVLIGLSPSARALSAVTQALVSTNFLFIENKIDNEYFITPSALNPRFSGANTWVKLGNDKQTSVGYMGIYNTGGWYGGAAYYKDMWIENSPISEPFRGLRCTKGANCPTSGFITADLIDQFGFYHAKTTGGGEDGGYSGFASLSDSAFEYFREMDVGGNETFKLNFCKTKINYDYAAGKRCKDEENAEWYIRPFKVNKVAHLSLFSTNAFQELFIASDGTPSINKDSGNCEIGVVDRDDGVICKMVAYTLNQESRISNTLYISMLADDELLGFQPGSDTIKYSGNGQTWTQYKTRTAYTNVFSNSDENKYIYVFLSKTFLKKIVENGISISNSQPFTFAFQNTQLNQSGYYEFTPSLQLNIVPKEYGISIVSSNYTSSSSGSGTIGDAHPIEMDYTVTVSGPRQADSITAQVIGQKTMINSVPYCLFTSAQGGLSVPIPAFLQYNSQSGGVVQKRNSCSEDAVSMRDAQWQQTPWDANNNDDGSYYSTDLKLLFPMNDSRSMLTVSGADWEGVVSASGEIKVTANWVGVTP